MTKVHDMKAELEKLREIVEAVDSGEIASSGPRSAGRGGGGGGDGDGAAKVRTSSAGYRSPATTRVNFAQTAVKDADGPTSRGGGAAAAFGMGGMGGGIGGGGAGGGGALNLKAMRAVEAEAAKSAEWQSLPVGRRGAGSIRGRVVHRIAGVPQGGAPAAAAAASPAKE